MKFLPLLDRLPRPGGHDCIALLGGGGKTALLHRLGSELASLCDRVLLTSLTKAARHDDDEVVYRETVELTGLAEQFRRRNPLYVMHTDHSREKLRGLSPEDLQRYLRRADCCLFECDGARSRPLKIHAPPDPPAPDFCSLAILVVGADVLDTTLEDGLVHRPERFAEHWGIDFDSPLGEDIIAEVLCSPVGYLAMVPEGMPRRYFVNKADAHPEQAARLAGALARRSGCATSFGSVQQGFWKAMS